MLVHELEEVVDPTKYTGLAAQEVDRLTEYVNEMRIKDENAL